MQALIFDIRRFSTHDGAGLRTTIFLKGCPLRCAWCQNPEGITYSPQLLYLKNQCIGCGKCAQISTNNIVTMQNNKPIFKIDDDIDWQKYIDICPAAALRMDSHFYTPDALLQEILKDKVFYRQTGGVTFSGGEPLAQSAFLKAFLPLLKNHSIHTAIETSLGVPWQNAEPVLSGLDLIYADLKIFDSAKHINYIGCSNTTILKNIQSILTSNFREKVIIRIPLIPNITATDKNLTQIGDFLFSIYPQVKLELLNYNPLAAAKYQRLKKTYLFEQENPAPFSQQKIDEFYNTILKTGITNIITV